MALAVADFEMPDVVCASRGDQVSLSVTKPESIRSEYKAGDSARVSNELDKDAVIVFEMMYRRIGWNKGPFATKSYRAMTRKFWANTGEVGSRWLVMKLLTETHPEILDGLSNLLADLGDQSVEPIIEGLNQRPRLDRAEALLSALGWMGTPDNVRQVLWSPLEAALGSYLSASAPDLREAACRAASILPRAKAITLFERYRSNESDECVKQLRLES